MTKLKKLNCGKNLNCDKTQKPQIVISFAFQMREEYIFPTKKTRPQGW